MKKRKNKKIIFSNRWLYTFIALGILAVIGVGVYAYGTSNPSTFGHSAGELVLTDAGKISSTTTGAYSKGQICGASNTQCLNFNNNGWVYMSDTAGSVYGGQGLAAEQLWAQTQLCLAGDCRTSWPSIPTNPSFGTVYTNNWFRSTGDSGWYSETYGGGWYMADPTWIRSYGSKNVYINSFLRADGGIASGDVASPGAGNIRATGSVTAASLTATGTVSMGYEIIEATGGASAVASCSAGKQVIGGGCECNAEVKRSYPVTATSWGCGCSGLIPASRSYAICARIA